MCSLYELIMAYTNGIIHSMNDRVRSFLRRARRFQLYFGNKNKSSLILLRVIKDIMEVLKRVHGEGMLHGNLAPHNILVFIFSETVLCAKLASFGFYPPYDGLRLDMGTEEGWGCPERQIGPAELKHDMFSLGLIIYFCITGSHPYGNIDNLYECETNMAKDDQMLISLYSEAKNLIERLLDSNPKKRPDLEWISAHPFLWDSTKKYEFICQIHTKLHRLPTYTSEFQHLLTWKSKLYGGNTDWSWCIAAHEYKAILALAKTTYHGEKLKDLPRMMRNIFQHFDEFSGGREELLREVEKVRAEENELNKKNETREDAFLWAWLLWL